MAVNEARFSSNFEDDAVLAIPSGEVEVSDPLPASTASESATAASLVTPTNSTNPFSAVEQEEPDEGGKQGRGFGVELS